MDLSVPHISQARLCASFSNVHTGQAHDRSFGAPDMLNSQARGSDVDRRSGPGLSQSHTRELHVHMRN